MKFRASVLAILTTLFLGGCATVKEGFVGEVTADVEPFAQATIDFLGSETIDFRENELIYLRFYVRDEDQAIQQLRDTLALADDIRDDVVFYSVELVRISESHTDEAAKAIDLADTLAREFREHYLSRIEIPESEFDAALANVRAQDNFLDALQAVQPLINRAGEYFEALVRDAEDNAVPRARAVIDERIEEEFSAVIKQLEVIHKRRYALMTGLQKIRAYRLGNSDALANFNDPNIVANRQFALSESPSDGELDAVKDYLIAELQKEDVILGLLEQDVEDYIATRAEFEREISEVYAGLYIARRQLVAWTRAHQDLANGVRNPGKWLKAIVEVAEGVSKVD